MKILNLITKKKSYQGAPGFEPGTSRSAVECSTTELYPHVLQIEKISVTSYCILLVINIIIPNFVVMLFCNLRTQTCQTTSSGYPVTKFYIFLISPSPAQIICRISTLFLAKRNIFKEFYVYDLYEIFTNRTTVVGLCIETQIQFTFVLYW